MVLRCLMKGELPVRPEIKTARKMGEKEDGSLKSQRMLLTWLTEYKSLYQAIRPYILPEDFSTDFYRQVASLLFAQLEEGQVNPAKIIDCFTDAEEQRQAASLFNTQVPVQTEEEQKKAIRETIRKVMETALEQRSASLDPSDIASLQKMIEGKRKLQELDRLHISLE